MGKIRVTLNSVYCGNTEDVTGADEFYMVGAVVTDDPNLRKGILTTPIDINDGQTKGFRPEEAVVFEGELPDNQSVGLTLQAYDEDAAKDWSKRPGWVDGITKQVGGAAGGAVVAGLASNPVGWTGIIAGTATGLALAGFYYVVGSDKDDQLGTTNIVIPVKGPADEAKSWSFSHHVSYKWYEPHKRWLDWYTDYDYTVAFSIHREGSNVVQPPVQPPDRPPVQPPDRPPRPKPPGALEP